jgi:hypothetical protein
MQFLAPLMMLGAVGIAIPVVIHLIGRRRARVVQFAAMDFLFGSNRKTARRFRLRELLLLLTRVLVCLAIPLALAKPYAMCTAAGPMVERGPQGAVLVIDDSFASGWSDGEGSLLDRARVRAADILEQLGPEAEVAIVLASEGSDSPTELSRDHIRLRDRIAELRTSARPADTTTALERAAQLLVSSSHERKTVFLLSPLAASGFRGDREPWAPDTGPQLSIVDLTGGGVPANVAVTDVGVEPDPSASAHGVAVTAEVVNLGAEPIEDRGLALRIADQEVARATLSLRPGERTKKTFLAAMPQDARAADIVVAVDPDALAIDDRRYVRAELREEVRVLLVNGDPHTVRHEDELFYLEAALRPGDRADGGALLTKVTAEELGEIELADHDVVVLANVHALPTQRVSALEAWVREGGGLLVAPGDNVDADAYNATMQPIIPQQLRDPIDVTYGAQGAEREGRALRLTKWEIDHPVFAVFAQDAAGLREARFPKIMLLGPTTRVDERKVLARYTNGATALVEARSGKGRLMLYTSTLDRDWNDLVIHPGFLPMIQKTIRYLARKDDAGRKDTVLVGRSAVLRVDPDVRRLEIRGPGGQRVVVEEENLDDRKYVRYSRTDRPGFYRVLVTDRRGEDVRRADLDFAVNIDPRGSDLRPVAPSDLPTSGGQQATVGQTEHERRVELWHAIAAGLLLLLLVESLLVVRS